MTKQEQRWMLLPSLFYFNDLTAGIIEELNVNGGSNHWYYNVGNFFAYIYYFYLFYQIVYKSFTKRIIKVFSIIYICIHLWYIFIYGSFYYLDVYGFVFAMTGIAIIAYLYLLELTDRDEGLDTAAFAFWFASAALIFNAGSIPVTVLVFLDLSLSNELAGRLWIINDIIYTFWYISMIISLLWTRKHIRTSSF